MSIRLRTFAKWLIVAFIGKDVKPRLIVRGLASGYRISVSPREHLSYLLGTAEPHLQKIIRQYVSAGDTTYDIGAYLGYVSLSLAKQVGSHGRVMAFEPVPRNAELVRQTIATNRLTTIRLFDVAASDTCGQTTIRITENLSTPSLVWHRNDSSSMELNIQTVTIDSLVHAGEIPPPKFVKIDVEGAEGLVLLGMRETIASSMPVLFLECSDLGRATSWNLLREVGYRCESATTGIAITSFDEYRHADFLWLPPEL